MSITELIWSNWITIYKDYFIKIAISLVVERKGAREKRRKGER